MNHPGMRHPGRWLWLLMLAPIVIGLTRLRFDVEVFDLLPPDLPAVEGLKIYQQHFANSGELVVTVQAADDQTAEKTARHIALRLREHTNLVAGAAWEPPWVEHPDEVAELIAYLWFNQPPPVFSQLASRLATNQLAAILAATRDQLTTSLSPEDIARLSYDPFGLTRLPENAAGAAPSFGQNGQGIFSSQDGTFRIVFVQSSRKLAGYRDCDRWLKSIESIAGSAAPGGQGAKSSIKLGFTGAPAFVAETATGMRHDIVTSVGGTAGIIAVLFWLAHRRVKPMLWLLTLLALILGSTLALGGLIFGTLNVVSMGFAAILLGLAVDYAVVHYQEALAHPDLSIPQIRHAIAPSIFWAAITTITAFLVLNLGGLPGLGQLGTLVGLGVGLSACIMIFEFLPPLFPGRNLPGNVSSTGGPPENPLAPPGRPVGARLIFGLTAVVVLLSLLVLMRAGWPSIDPTADALRPQSPAYTALDQIQANLNQKREPIWLIIGGRTEDEAAGRLEEIQPVLRDAVSNHVIAGFTLPASLWPRPRFQAENRGTALHLAAERGALRDAASAAGFLQSSLGLTEKILDDWQAAGTNRGAFQPTNSTSRWIFDRVMARTPTNYFALGLLTPADGPGATRLVAVESDLARDGVWPSDWNLLGRAIFSRVKTNLWRVVAPMVVLVLLSLWLAFRRPVEILLSLTVLLLSGLVLLAAMREAGWSWNLLNLMAIPLILGTGVDYSIFMQLALRRYEGDLGKAYHSVGRALLLCGGTAVGAFGSLTFSSNSGLASLGRVCAIGIASNMLIAVFLLPVWWRTSVLKARGCAIGQNK